MKAHLKLILSLRFVEDDNVSTIEITIDVLQLHTTHKGKYAITPGTYYIFLYPISRYLYNKVGHAPRLMCNEDNQSLPTTWNPVCKIMCLLEKFANSMCRFN